LSVAELRSEGLLPEAICRYLAGLGRGTIEAERGWNIVELASDFNPTKYRSGEIVYSKSALLSENQKYLRSLSADSLLRKYISWSGVADSFGNLPPTRHALALSLAVETASNLLECSQGLKSIVDPPDPHSISKEDYAGGAMVLKLFIQALKGVEFTESNIQSALNSTGQELGVKGRNLYHPIRLALTGVQHGPKLAAIMLLLERQDCIGRLERFYEFILSGESAV
jgi:glutamyl/glutaminyl-tRNA synthetase